MYMNIYEYIHKYIYIHTQFYLSISWAISCAVCTISACISSLSCNSTLEFSITLGCPRLGCTLPPSSSACSSLDCILSVCSGDSFFVYWRGISPVYSGGICTLFVLHVNFPCLRTGKHIIDRFRDEREHVLNHES